MANVRLENIKRRFNNVTAVEDITFEVPDGQFWVLGTIGLWQIYGSADDRWAGNRHRWETLHWDVLL